MTRRSLGTSWVLSWERNGAALEELPLEQERIRAAQGDDEASRRHRDAIISAIAKLHTQTGHPSPEALARAIRIAGGSDAAVAAALSYRCGVCNRHRDVGPALPHTLHDSLREL